MARWIGRTMLHFATISLLQQVISQENKQIEFC